MPDLAAVKSWLGITEATWDADLAALLARTLDAVSRELDWYFGEPRAAVEILDGTGLRSLWLRQYIVGSTLTVQDRGTVGDAWATVAATEYEYATGGRGLYNVGSWTRGVRNYRASYTEGFAVMPGDVEQLILDLVRTRWEGRTGTDPGMKSETIGDYSYTRADLEEMPGWGAVWAHWKRGRI